MMIHKLAAFGSFLFLFAACAVDTTIPPEGFDRSCKVDADCAVVTTGDVCGCNCGNDAINVSSLPKYKSELDSKFEGCSGEVACDCVATIAVCEKGMCKQTTPK